MEDAPEILTFQKFFWKARYEVTKFTSTAYLLARLLGSTWQVILAVHKHCGAS